jgi:hypothetical protein
MPVKTTWIGVLVWVRHDGCDDEAVRRMRGVHQTRHLEK